MISKIKKIILCLILAVTIFQTSAPAISQIGVIGVAYAEETASDETVMHIEGVCGVTAVWGCITAGIYYITQFIHYLSTFVTWAGGEIFDGAMLFSISGSIFEAGIIEEGWKLMRDFANLFFIFIILYIAIATILQIGTYGGKELLVKVIVVAVLINFSLLFARMIIDASHVLAWSFYNKIDTQGQAKFPQIPGAVQIVDIKKDGVAKVISSAVIVGTGVADVTAGSYRTWSSWTNLLESVKYTGKSLFAGEFKNAWFGAPEEDETKKSNQEKLMEAVEEGKEILPVTFMQMSVLYILSATLNFIAGFIFFASAALFIIRVVVLWILMIFAPLGFILPIMPKALAAHAGKWWDTLIRQSFFAPAYLFMLLIVTEIINSNFLKGTIIAAEKSAASSFLPFNVDETLIVIFHFMVVAFLMIMALYVAKQMGAIGSDMAMKYGKQAGDFARNKFGDRAAMRWGTYGAKRTAGLAGEGLLRSQLDKDGKQNKFGKIIGAIPLVNSGFARASTWREKQLKAEEKSRKEKFGSYSDAGLTAMKGQVFTKSASKTIEGIETKRSAETEKKKRIESEKEELKNLKAVQSNASIAKDKLKEEIEKNEEVLEGLETKLVTQNYKLSKAINDGDTDGEASAIKAIDDTKQARLKKNAEKKIREGYIKQIEKEETRKKELEDKEERRKETEGLQGAIGSSGGGGGSKKL